MQAIAIIPARGGSKGVHRKNVRLLAGRPLVAHSILDAREAGLISNVYVSTDDPEIARVSQVYGAEVIQRPPELASDTASSESALLHALEELETTGLVTDLIVFLQCTSPIRTGADIDRAILQLRETGQIHFYPFLLLTVFCGKRLAKPLNRSTTTIETVSAART